MWGAEHGRSRVSHLLVVPLTIHNTYKTDQTWTSVGVEFWKERLETQHEQEGRDAGRLDENRHRECFSSAMSGSPWAVGCKTQKANYLWLISSTERSVKLTCSINCTLSFTFPLPMAPP